MKSTATPDSRSVLATRKRRSTSKAERAAVGSSITITRASRESAFPISASCCSAIESPRAIRSGSSRTPRRSKIASAWLCIARRSTRRRCAGLAADEDVLDTVRSGKSVGSW